MSFARQCFEPWMDNFLNLKRILCTIIASIGDYGHGQQATNRDFNASFSKVKESENTVRASNWDTGDGWWS